MEELRRGYLLGHAAENAPTVAWAHSQNHTSQISDATRESYKDGAPTSIAAEMYAEFCDALIIRPKVAP